MSPHRSDASQFENVTSPFDPEADLHVTDLTLEERHSRPLADISFSPTNVHFRCKRHALQCDVREDNE